MDSYLKDPSAVLDWRFDWKALTNGYGDTDWLAAAETISSFIVTADTGITVDSSALASTNTAVVVWLSGGTAGTYYNLKCYIVTSAGRKDERTIQIRVMDR